MEANNTLELLKCPVCLEVTYDAYVSNCGHTVCGFCYRQMLQKRPGYVCPMCQRDTIFTPNYIVRSLLEQPSFAEAVKRCKHHNYPSLVKITYNDFDTIHTATIIEWFDKTHKNGQLTNKQVKDFLANYNNLTTVWMSAHMKGFACDVNDITSPGIIFEAHERIYMFFMSRKSFIE
jgi:hypothetical protein